MSNQLTRAIGDYEKAVIAAGGLISQQEAENQRRITQAGEGKGGTSDPALSGLPLPGKQSPVAIPNGPNTSDIMMSGTATNLPGIPCPPSDSAGRFACAAAPESVGGITLDLCVSNLSSAQAARPQTVRSADERRRFVPGTHVQPSRSDTHHDLSCRPRHAVPLQQTVRPGKEATL